MFGKWGIKHLSEYINPIKEEVIKSNLAMLFEIYVGKMLFMASVSFIAVFVSLLFTSILFGFPIWFALMSGLVGAVTTSLLVLTLFHSYPFQILTSRKNNIEGNMPFAINHMAAIASSGVPPFVLFKLLTNVPEYGEIRNESRRVVRNIEVFGMDVTSAVRNVAERTPSDRFKQFLFGIISSVDTGGDLKQYLEDAAKSAMFDYKLKREKYLQTLSTYADFYTAVLIAAPLFFVSILSIMSLIGGDVMGLSIPVAMQLGIYILIPVLNTIFLLFIHFTQPTL